MKWKSGLVLLLICILCAAIGSGCGSPSSPSVNDEPAAVEPTPTDAPAIEEPTSVPVEPTADLTDLLPPTDPNETSVEPTETPEPRPGFQNYLSDEGPWLVYAAADGVYALNTDGSGLTKLYANSPDYRVESIQIAAAPQGGNIAVLQVDGQDRFELGLPRLKTFLMPDAYLVLDTWLIPYEWEAETYIGDPDEKTTEEQIDIFLDKTLEQLFVAIGKWNQITWSGDGSKLAFNAVFDGTSVDLYLYDDNKITITRLTDGPNHSVDPIFSPDDSYILHGAVTSLNYGHTDPGYQYLNVWAAKADGKKVEKVSDNQFIGKEKVLGWLNDTTYFGSSWAFPCQHAALRIMDILKGQQSLLYSGNFDVVSVAPDAGRALFSVSEYVPEVGCKTDFDPGVYLLDTNYKNSAQIPEIDPDSVISIEYNPVMDSFYVSEAGRLHLIQMDGSTQSFDAPKSYMHILSPDGTRWMFWRNLADVSVTAGDLNGLYKPRAFTVLSDPVWLPDSSAVLFFVEQNDGTTALVKLSFLENGDETEIDWLAKDLPKPFTISSSDIAQIVLVNP